MSAAILASVIPSAVEAVAKTAADPDVGSAPPAADLAIIAAKVLFRLLNMSAPFCLKAMASVRPLSSIKSASLRYQSLSARPALIFPAAETTDIPIVNAEVILVSYT